MRAILGVLGVHFLGVAIICACVCCVRQLYELNATRRRLARSASGEQLCGTPIFVQETKTRFALLVLFCTLCLSVVLLGAVGLWPTSNRVLAQDYQPHARTPGLRRSPEKEPVILTVVVLSDTHGKHRSVTVPEGDLLIHAGDFTHFGRLDQAADFNAWLGEQKHRHKVVISGNHDGPGSYATHSGGRPVTSLSVLPGLITNAHYLQDGGFSFEISAPGGSRAVPVSIWGSPWQPQYSGFETFRARNHITDYWEEIPDNTTILVTHTPPAGVMDGGGQGCVSLRDRIESLVARHRRGLGGGLRLAAFGHFHEGGMMVRTQDNMTFVNCAICDDSYKVKHQPRVLHLEL